MWVHRGNVSDVSRKRGAPSAHDNSENNRRLPEWSDSVLLDFSRLVQSDSWKILITAVVWAWNKPEQTLSGPFKIKLFLFNPENLCLILFLNPRILVPPVSFLQSSLKSSTSSNTNVQANIRTVSQKLPAELRHYWFDFYVQFDEISFRGETSSHEQIKWTSVGSTLRLTHSNCGIILLIWSSSHLLPSSVSPLHLLITFLNIHFLFLLQFKLRRPTEVRPPTSHHSFSALEQNQWSDTSGLKSEW